MIKRSRVPYEKRKNIYCYSSYFIFIGVKSLSMLDNSAALYLLDASDEGSGYRH